MVKTVLPVRGAQVESLVEEPRSHMSQGAAKEKKKKENRECPLFLSPVGARVHQYPLQAL